MTKFSRRDALKLGLVAITGGTVGSTLGCANDETSSKREKIASLVRRCNKKGEAFSAEEGKNFAETLGYEGTVLPGEKVVLVVGDYKSRNERRNHRKAGFGAELWIGYEQGPTGGLFSKTKIARDIIDVNISTLENYSSRE